MILSVDINLIIQVDVTQLVTSGYYTTQAVRGPITKINQSVNLSRPWADILPVRPSRLVNKIYVDGHLCDRLYLCHCTCSDWPIKSILVQQMLGLLLVSHYLRYHACFDRSELSQKSSSAFWLCMVRERETKDAKHAITCTCGDN